jgi:hypothetical protein
LVSVQLASLGLVLSRTSRWSPSKDSESLQPRVSTGEIRFEVAAGTFGSTQT